ncbi:MAG: polyprenyl synthetase family protein [Deltaproteobacteria bacterium]|nr:MAG: polyprenyl synthetase family protein [Deltaproteobacteria bacterium]
MDLKKYLDEKKNIVDSALERYFSKDGEPSSSLHRAIRHSLFAGGKRIRPIFSIASFEAVGGKGDRILPLACALEVIHTYSLIHDDLPSIDNDDFRRGKPTFHKVFGEGVALLAGDALLTEAFRLMTDRAASTDPEEDGWLIVDIVNQVARAAGISGMVAGQVVDIESEGREIDLPTVQFIHTHKTGAMILVSIQSGAKLGRAATEPLKALTRYGERVGLAFQIADDILNVEGQAALLGKSTGSDRLRGKATYPGLLGLEESKRRARELVEMAVDALKPFGGEADPLREIAHFIIERKH